MNHKWTFGVFAAVCGATVIGAIVSFVVAVGWSVTHWDDSMSRELELAIIAIPIVAFVVSLVIAMALAIRRQATTGSHTVTATLIGGLVLPLVLAAVVAGLLFSNQQLNQREKERSQQLGEAFDSFLPNAWSGIPGYGEGQIRTSNERGPATRCDDESVSSRTRLIWVDGGVSEAEHFHGALVDDDFEVVVKRFRNPLDTYESLVVAGVRDDTYVDGRFHLTPDDSRLLFTMMAGNCVSRNRSKLLDDAATPGVPIDANFEQPRYLGRTHSDVRSGIVAPWELNFDQRLAKDCPSGTEAHSGGVSTIWRNEAGENHPHLDGVELLADIHGALSSAGWDTRLESLSVPGANRGEVRERRQLLASFGDTAVLFVASFATETENGQSDPTTGIFVRETIGTCVAELGFDALFVTAGDWVELTDPMAFTPLDEDG